MIDGFRRLMRGETTIDFVGRSRLWATISLVVVLVSLIGLIGPGLNLGLDFSGGTALSVPVRSDAEVTDFQDAMTDEGVEGTAQITVGSDGTRQVLIRTQETDEESLATLQQVVATTAGQVDPQGNPIADVVSRTTVGPTWGQQITNKAVRALLVFIVLVSIVISIRFEPKMAVAALAALLHDLLWTAGVYAIVGFEVTPATLIALLSLMGYSLYDTVVVFDRVKENADMLQATSKTTYSAMVNRSLNEVLMRSVNTSVSSVLPVAGLLFVGVFLFGAVTLRDLALAMFIGTSVSIYSSIFVATPLLAKLKEREAQYQAMRRRTEGKAQAVGSARARPAPAAPAATGPTDASPEIAFSEAEPVAPAQPARAAPPMPSGPPRPQRKRRGKRRKRR